MAGSSHRGGRRKARRWLTRSRERWLTAALLLLAACSGAPPPSASPAPSPPPGRGADRLPQGMHLAEPAGHLATITCLSFSPDGRQIVSGAEDRSLLVWDLESRRIVRRLEGHSGFVSGCAFLPDGQRIVSGGPRSEVLVWDPATPGSPRRLTGLDAADAVYSLSIRADGREVLVGTATGRVMAWELSTGKATFDNYDLQKPPTSIVWTVGYLENGSRFAGGQSGMILWGKPKPRRVEGVRTSGLPLPGGQLLLGDKKGISLMGPSHAERRIGKHEAWVYGLALSPRRDVVVAGDDGGHARVWSLADGALRCELPDGSAGFRTAASDSTGKLFAVAGEDATVLIAEWSDCAVTHRLHANRGRIMSLAAGTSVLLGDSTGRVSGWSPNDWRMQTNVRAHAGEVTALAVLPDGRWVSGGSDARVAVSSPPSSRPIGQLPNFSRELQPTADGRSILSVDNSGTLTALSLDGSAPTKLFTTGGAPLYALSIRPGKTEAVIGGAISQIYRFTLPEGRESARWPRIFQSVTDLAYSPDGQWLAEGDTRGNVALRNADTGAIERRLMGLDSQVSGLHLTRDHLWAGGYDKRLVRWSLASGADPDLPPIDEGSPISDLAATSDGRFLIAALGDGRAAVHALPNGGLVAHLIPLRDGSWATVHADGRYEASQGEALALRFEDRSTRKVITLGHLPDPLSFGQVSAARLPEGPVRVRATVFSSHGPPQVRLDDRWAVNAIAPSPSSLTAYEVDFLLADLSEIPHRLTASALGGAPAQASFTPPPAMRNAPSHPRALLIGNGAYADPSVPALPGAAKDADDLARALQDPDSWALDPAHLEVKKDLGADAMEKTIQQFFRNTGPEETLLFYFAGHGDTDGSEGYLVPVDYRPKPPGRRISASALWSWIEESRASQVVVILDACRTGAFLLPASVARKAKERRVLFLTSTSAGVSAKDTQRGGAFTQGLVEAFKREESIDPFFHAVTFYKAFLHAGHVASDQVPQFFGDEKLYSVPLAWPRPAGTRLVTTPITIDKRTASAELADVEASLVTDRQIAAQGEVKGAKLEVRVVFGEETDWLRIGVYSPDTATEKPRLEAFYPNTTGPRWRKSQRVTISMPLAGLTQGTYRVEVEPCGAKKACGKQAAEKFKITL